MQHALVGFTVGFGQGLYGVSARGLLFSALMLALLVALHVLVDLWPLAFPKKA